jgi:surface polysaccharide O-acyltransferase-like enzyme
MSIAYTSGSTQRDASAALHARINGIDVFRFLAVVGVVFIHASDKTTIGNALDLASRFGVPFFFIVAGYFAGLKPKLSFLNEVRHVGKRIIGPYLVWLALYTVYSGYDFSNLLSIRGLMLLFVYAGPGWHLWFLTSLAFSVMMLAILRRLCELRTLVGLAIVVYIAGLAIGPYARIVFSIANLGIHPRNGLFLGFPFMVMGYWIGRNRWSGWPFLAGALLYLGGFMLTIGEVYGLSKLPGGVNYDVLLGTVPMAAGAFIMALRLPDIPVTRHVSNLGRYSLGIFASHLALMFEVQRLLAGTALSTEMVVVILTVATASLCALVLGQFRLTRSIVR